MLNADSPCVTEVRPGGHSEWPPCHRHRFSLLASSCPHHFTLGLRCLPWNGCGVGMGHVGLPEVPMECAVCGGGGGGPPGACFFPALAPLSWGSDCSSLLHPTMQ